MAETKKSKKAEKKKTSNKSEDKKSFNKQKIDESAEVKKKSENKGRKSYEDDQKALKLEEWKPKTRVGKAVAKQEITDIDSILDDGQIILEEEIVDTLLPDIKTDLLLIGQAKGKFGGGQRRIFRQTQKKTREGNKIHFSTFAVAGNENGYVGIGSGKSKETVPARDKAKRAAKINIIKIRRGCGSPLCNCKTPHSIPFQVTGKCGSVKITLIPAPKGKGLVVGEEIAKILKLAGIKDIWSKTEGMTSTRINLIRACFNALKKLISTKVRFEDYEKLGIMEGNKAHDQFLSNINKE